MFTLTLLGSTQLTDANGQPVDRVLAQPKLLALLSYLAVPTVGRFRRRDDLVGKFWPNLDHERARAALRKAVHAIRSATTADTIISRGDEELAVSASRLSCDAALLTAAADDGRLAEALERDTGELMPGFHLGDSVDFDHWLSDERAALQERIAAAAWALAQRYERDQHLSDAAQWARRSVRSSWHDERALRRALTMLERLGDRAGAVRLYEEFARRLRTDLSVNPSPETRALVDAMRANRAPDRGP